MTFGATSSSTSHLRWGDGPEGARVMIVGEAFGETEEEQGMPFVGASGQLLNSMLHDAGIMRSECYVTNLVNARPPGNDLTKWIPVKKGDITPAHVPLRGRKVLPIVRQGYDQLQEEIRRVRPDLVIATGNFAMWALTGEFGILKWRGSQLYSDMNPSLKVLPTIHPAAVLREYSLRPVVVTDLRRAARHRYSGPWNNLPEWNFHIRPSIGDVLDRLAWLTSRCEREPTWVELDLETSPVHITCIGLSWTRTDALCIPFSWPNGDHYWGTDEEEGAIIYALYRLLTHPNCWVRGQNLLYDCQHTYRWWHFVPNVKQDTMISHHTCFAGMKKSLAFQASMYADYYVYWKEMHKDESNKAGA